MEPLRHHEAFVYKKYGRIRVGTVKNTENMATTLVTYSIMLSRFGLTQPSYTPTIV